MIRVEKRSVATLLKYLAGFFVSLIFINHPAHAAGECGRTLWTYFNFSKIVVPPGLPNGSVIATVEAEAPFSCSYHPDGYLINVLVGGRASTGIPNVVKYASLPWAWQSVGFRLTDLGKNKVIPLDYGASQWLSWGWTNGSGTIRLKIEMIKLDNGIYGGKFDPGNYRMFDFEIRKNTYPNDLAGTFLFNWRHNGTSIEQMVKSCSVTTNPVNVPLSPVASSSLSTVGMTAGDKPFEIGLSCKAGSNVFVTMTDLTNQGNTSDQLTLTPDSGAKGVKLRILRGGTPVGYGPDSAAVGNTNQWYVGPSGSTSRIPLTAQYIATGPVTAGTVKGVATFTLSYQ